MNQSIKIYESRKSEKLSIVVTGNNSLLEYCTQEHANKLQRAANNSKLDFAYFTKSGNIRAVYFK